MVIEDEMKIVGEKIKEISISLKDHEVKDFCLASVPIANYERYIIAERIFYVVPNNVFNAIINRNLILAQKNYPDNFGTGNARDVVKALYEIEQWMTFESYIRMLGREQFCYVVEIKDGKIIPKILRIDLYRSLKKNKKGGYDFVGGLFHCFKHYSRDGQPLSTGSDINDLNHPRDLVYKIIIAFFFSQLELVEENKFNSEIAINDVYVLKFSFFYEVITGVYFINTSHKRKRQ